MATSRRFRRERWHDKLLETLRRQPPEWRKQTCSTLRDEAVAQEVAIYDEAGKFLKPVRVHLLPLLVTTAQCRYLHFLGVRIRRAVTRMLRAYRDDPALRAVLPLTDDERAWFEELAPNGFPEPMTVFERLDTNVVLDDPEWRTH